MSRIIWVLGILAAGITGRGQSLDSLLQIVERFNPEMISLQKWLESEEVRASTGIYPENPEVNYMYLFGSPGPTGDQQELEVMQSFRLPGYYTSKAGIRDKQFEQEVVMAEREKRDLFYRFSENYLNLVWLRKTMDLLDVRRSNSERLVRLMEEAFEQGEVSRATYERAKLYDLNTGTEWRKTAGEWEIRRERLEQMTGGVDLEHLSVSYPETWTLPPEDTLLVLLSAENPELRMAKLNIEEVERRIRFEKWNRWPTLQVGYKSETILDQKLQGFHSGVSIPLWENRNKIRQAQLQHEWSLARYRQAENELITELRSRYNEVATNYENYMAMKEMIGGTELLEYSLDLLVAGQISFPEYLVEIDFYRNAVESFLRVEKDYYLGIAGIKKLIPFE